MPASTPHTAFAAVPHRGAWMAMLALVLPLLSWITPQYEATGVSVAPLAPALAVALAGVSLWGWRALPAVALGALAAAFGWPIGAPDPFKLFEVLTLVMQAAFGGMLLRRSGRTDDSALDTLAALRRLIAAALACGIIGALMRVVADLVWSTDPTLRPGTLALVRATADAASVVLLMPVLMAVFSPLRERWRMRRRTVAVPLLVVAALMLVAFAAVEDRDRQQAQQRFERDAEVVYSRTQALLDAPVHALQAMQGAFNAAAGGLTSTQFDNLARVWVKRSLGMGSIGWLEAPTRPVAPGAAASPAPPPDEMRPLTLRHAIGAVPISVLELPAVRQSVVRAIAQDEPVVSAPLALGTALDARSGVILLQNLPNGSASSAWLAFAVVSPDALVAPIVAARADALRACLYDTDSRLDRRRLAGAAGCETALPADHLFTRETAFVYAGRRWTLRTSQPVRTSGGVWLFALPALGGGALFAMLLSGMTGQVQRVRGEARSRTDELRHEIDERARTLAVHERTVHTLMDTVQIGMALIDPEGRIRRVNTALAELAGVRADALQGQLLDEVLVDPDHPAAGRFARLIAGAGDTLAHQAMRLHHADVREMPALVTLRVLRDDAGHALSAICAVHDLSENLRRRQVERVLGDVLNLSRGAGASSSASTTIPVELAHGEQRVLCIAADAGLASELRTALHDRPRIVLSAASGGPQGLVAARTLSPRLVLLDLDLPDADSLALMRTLTAEGLPVVVLSRDLRPQRIEAAFSAGARGYLTLPPEPRELLAVVDDLL